MSERPEGKLVYRSRVIPISDRRSAYEVKIRAGRGCVSTGMDLEKPSASVPTPNRLVPPARTGDSPFLYADPRTQGTGGDIPPHTPGGPGRPAAW